MPRGSLDDRRPDGGRRRHRFAALAKSLDVELDRFADQLLDLADALAGGHAAGQVEHVGGVGLAFTFEITA